MSFEIPTWPKITGALGSTTTEFGASDWANLISDYLNGENLALVDVSKLPVIGSLTKFKNEKLALYDTDGSHYISFSADDIDTGANRKIKFRRMNSPFTDDYAVLEGMPQTIINKTIDSDLNTITNISNTQIKSGAAIPYSKLNLTGTILNADVNASAAIVTTKLADSTNFVLTTRANTFGDFDNTFKDNRLKINNPADTFAYTIIAAAIGANRNLTLPLLTGNDTVVAEAHAATLINKTIDADGTGNSITNIENADIKAAAGIVTTKLADSTNFVLTTRANSFGDFDNTFKDNRLKINNPADTFAYTIIGAAIAANRNLTLPLLTGNDVVVTEAFAQALSNKSIDADTNTITNIENADIKAAAGIVTSKLADSSNFVLKTLDNSFGAHYQDFTKMTAPGNPGANDIRLYVDTSDTHLKIRNNAGTVVDLHTGGGGATNLDGLTDVVISSPSTGQVIKYNGTNWINDTDATGGGGGALDDVTDVTITSIAANQAIVRNGANTAYINALIADANITAHTSTKVTITAKGQLNSAILYNDANQDLGAFYHDIGEIAAPSAPAANKLRVYMDNGDESLRVKNSSNTVFNLFSPTGLVDANIGSHTSTKITITAKGQLNSAIVYNDQANVFGANNQTIPIANLLLSNNSNTGAFGVQASLTGTRVWSMPNSSTNIMGHDTTDTMINKTYNTTDNTLTATSQATGDILANNGTKFVRKARGSGLQVLRTNSGATDIEWASLDSERTGKATANGNASTTVFNIAHGLGATPSYAFISVGQSGSAFIGTQYTVDGTNIVVTFASAPASGTGNVIIYWRVIA
jgi:hypothetical protein